MLYIYSGYVTAFEYYVSATPNGESCSHTHLPCHNLSYYTDDYTSYFTNDTIFYFLEGTHILQDTLEISHVSNITLQGLGHIEQGFHETVMQSTSVIMCSDYDRGGIQFTNSTNIVLKSLTIANCGGLYNTSYQLSNVSLLLDDTYSITLEWVSVQNGSGIGFYLYNAFDVLIANSTFANNGGLKYNADNAVIFYDDQVKRLSRVNIVKSNFTLGLGSGMNFSYFSDNKVEVIIEKSKFSYNTAQYGGGITITSYARSGSIEFSNCTIYDNIAQYGGGVYIYFVDGRGSIEVSNCTVYGNTAQNGGGGVAIYLHNGSGSIEVSNCTIYNNTAQIGGGVDIYFVDGSGSIEVSNCTIYDNIAQHGGGVDIYFVDGRGSIEVSNCTVYGNTAQNGGGGVAIYLHNGSGSIEVSNCTIYNNTAQIGGGVYIYFVDGRGSIEVSNCTVYGNTAQNGGGGVAIYLHNGSGSIEVSNCTIYNNTAQIGGGVDIYFVDGRGSIEVSNCTVYGNTAQNGGGGVGIYLHNGSSSIEVSNCTIYNNTAQFGGGAVIYLHNGSVSIEFSNCTIYNNTAQFGGGAVIYLHNGSVSIEVSNCTIYNNTAQIGGGVYIYFVDGRGSIEVSNCTIYNNTAQFGGGAVIYLHNGSGSIEVSNCTIYNNTAQIGGGVYIYFVDGRGSIEVSNCTIYNNTAQNGGGGVGIYLLNGSVSIEVSNCTIYNNTAQIGGGVDIYLLNGSGSIEVSNCTIYNNTAQYGGGVDIYLHNGSVSIEVSNCTIYNNTAHYGSGLNALQDASTSRIHFTNISFYFNKVSNKHHKYHSILLLENIKNVTFDQIDISNHDTTGLLSINSLIMFDGHNTFINNSGINGGGMALYGFSQLLLKQNTNISFVNNHASESGGGIFVSQVIDDNNLTICSFKNFLYYNTIAKTMLYFVNNTADVSGDVLYGSKISFCLHFDFDHQFHYPQQTGLSVVSSDPIQVCFCESNRQNCSIRNINITAIPGINVNISLATVGNKDGLTKGVIKLTTSDGSSSNVQTDNPRLNATCTNVTFKLIANPSLNTTQVYVTSESSISEPSSDPLAKLIKVNIESCPIGYPLVNNACSCRSELNTSSITCDINTQIITRDDDMWIGYKNDSDCLIVYPHCPFDYCNDGKTQFKITFPDPQCLLNRSGILCGQCTNGLSLMLGSNQCGQCSNNYIALIILFALAGIALVAFIIALNLTVSVGTINGLIFYANVVKIYEPIFFPNGPVKLLSQFISWLNLDLGIETCFFDGMDSCSKTWLQFVFPGYVWFLLILIIILSQYSSKVVRLVGSHAVPVLATMILLSYTKLIRTVFQALYFINIQCNGNNNVPLLRWYIDANVQYFRGYCHLPLFLFSLAVLILLIVPYTFYLLTIPLLEGPLSKYMHCCQKLWRYMKPFFDAYGGPYRDKCRFWTGFLLLVRVVLALVVSLDIEATISLDVLTSLLFVIISMYFLLKGIYRHLPLACLEMSFFLNLMFMAYVSVQTYKASNSRQVLSVALVTVSFVVFCGIILYHVWDQLSKSCLKRPFAKITRVFKKPPSDPVTDDAVVPLMRPGSPALICNTSSVSVVSVVMRRESLLDDEDD